MRQDCKFGLGYSVYIGMYVGLSRKKKGGGENSAVLHRLQGKSTSRKICDYKNVKR